jgi:hypothetical protein
MHPVFDPGGGQHGYSGAGGKLGPGCTARNTIVAVVVESSYGPELYGFIAVYNLSSSSYSNSSDSLSPELYFQEAGRATSQCCLPVVLPFGVE